uniref:Uncharacterized protein n=1 Tax=Oryza sativa subsp. japonica TaxID=39947 RepID=Q652X0_ORYSJ|nr:hypothetical protein [Oryza sativa Japonica Group]
MATATTMTLPIWPKGRGVGGQQRQRKGEGMTMRWRKGRHSMVEDRERSTARQWLDSMQNLCHAFAIQRSHGCERATMAGHVYGQINRSTRSDGGVADTGA